MTLKQAEKVVDEWYQKARRLGGIVVNSWDVADMRAYLSQQPAPYYSLKTGDHEFREPPTRDPRFDPASPWSKAWPYLEAEMRANEKN